jgi:predicted nucleic acid-binding protein
MTGERVVLDASALVDLLAEGPEAVWLMNRLQGCLVAAPAHLKAEVLSALGRRVRSGISTAAEAEAAVSHVASSIIEAHPLEGLLAGAWERRENLRLVDALYVELAAQLDTVVITTDRRLARATPLAVAPPD